VLQKIFTSLRAGVAAFGFCLTSLLLEETSDKPGASVAQPTA